MEFAIFCPSRVDRTFPSAHKSSAADMLLAERGRIDSSHQMTDEILEYVHPYYLHDSELTGWSSFGFTRQAYETRADFTRQRTTITGINTRMAGVLSTMPGINSILGMIKSRRRRDSIVVGCLIGVCLILLLSYITK
jgi:Golgi SNAP receptor complex protein 1